MSEHGPQISIAQHPDQPSVAVEDRQVPDAVRAYERHSVAERRVGADGHGGPAHVVAGARGLREPPRILACLGESGVDRVVPHHRPILLVLTPSVLPRRSPTGKLQCHGQP
jgi:hypothetical protein